MWLVNKKLLATKKRTDLRRLTEEGAQGLDMVVVNARCICVKDVLITTTMGRMEQ